VTHPMARLVSPMLRFGGPDNRTIRGDEPDPPDTVSHARRQVRCQMVAIGHGRRSSRSC